MTEMIKINDYRDKRLRKNVAYHGNNQHLRFGKGTPAAGAAPSKVISFHQPKTAVTAANPAIIARRSIEVIQDKLDRQVSLYAFCPESTWLVRMVPEPLQQVMVNLFLYINEAMGSALDKIRDYGSSAQFGTPYIMIELENAKINASAARPINCPAHDCYVVLTISGYCNGLLEEGGFAPSELQAAIADEKRLRASAALVRQNQGWLDIHSTAGKHISFRAFLPRFAEAPTEPGNAKEGAVLSHAGGEAGRSKTAGQIMPAQLPQEMERSHSRFWIVEAVEWLRANSARRFFRQNYH